MQSLDTFFSKSWQICFQTYHQVNKMKLCACLTFLPSSSTLLESECHHQVGFIKSSHVVSAFVLNSSEDSLTYFMCIFWQYIFYGAFMTVFRVWYNSLIICSLSMCVHCSKVTKLLILQAPACFLLTYLFFYFRNNLIGIPFTNAIGWCNLFLLLAGLSWIIAPHLV